MAKKWQPQELTRAEEELLIHIGQADHLFADDRDPRINDLRSLLQKGLIFLFRRTKPGDDPQRHQAWAVTSEGFFTFKWLLRERIRQSKKGAGS